MFQTHLTDKEAAGASAATQYKTIPTFLTLFIFGFLYELVLTWDALRLKNTIQIIGLCIANLALLVYTAIQIDQIETAIDDLDTAGALSGSYTTSSGTAVTSSEALWDEIQGPLIAIPIVLAVVTIILSYFAWKLYQAFAWDILKQIGADYRMKKRFLHYQVRVLDNVFCHQSFASKLMFPPTRSILPCSSLTSSSSWGSLYNSLSSSAAMAGPNTTPQSLPCP